MGVFKNITHTHKCPIAIIVWKSKPGIVDDANNAGTTALERAVARSAVIASGQEEERSVFYTLMKCFWDMVH